MFQSLLQSPSSYPFEMQDWKQGPRLINFNIIEPILVAIIDIYEHISFPTIGPCGEPTQYLCHGDTGLKGASLVSIGKYRWSWLLMLWLRNSSIVSRSKKESSVFRNIFSANLALVKGQSLWDPSEE